MQRKYLTQANRKKEDYIFMGNTFSMPWEDSVTIFIQKYMSDITVKLAGIITEFGDALILVAIIGMFYWALNKDLGKRLVVSLAFINIVNPCVKSSVKRLRPYMVNRDIQCLKPVNKDGDIYDVVTQEYSFPSGHAANCITAYGQLAYKTKNTVWRVILIVLILLVGISRFSLGVHYVTDVLAGWVLGVICVLLFSLLEKKLGRYKTYILLDIAGIAGFFIATTNDFYTGYGLLLGSTLGIMFEENFVRFDGTKKVLPVILRTAIGAGLFLVLDKLLKLPFPQEFLTSGTMPAFIVRAARYAIVTFLLLGIYPMIFKPLKKIFS